MVERRYSALRTIAGLHKFAAWLCFALAVIAFLVGLGAGAGGFLAGLVTVVAALIAGLVLMAIGESILVVIDIEENTRRVADKLDPRERVLEAVTPAAAVVPPPHAGDPASTVEAPQDPSRPRLVTGRNGRRYFVMPDGKCRPVGSDGTPDLVAEVVPGRDEPGWRAAR